MVIFFHFLKIGYNYYFCLNALGSKGQIWASGKGGAKRSEGQGGLNLFSSYVMIEFVIRYHYIHYFFNCFINHSSVALLISKTKSYILFQFFREMMVKMDLLERLDMLGKE